MINNTRSYVISDFNYTVELDPEFFPNAVDQGQYLRLEAINVSKSIRLYLNHSYACFDQQEWNMQGYILDRLYNATLTFFDIHVEAFKHSRFPYFSPADICKPIRTKSGENDPPWVLGEVLGALALCIAVIFCGGGCLYYICIYELDFLFGRSEYIPIRGE